MSPPPPSSQSSPPSTPPTSSSRPPIPSSIPKPYQLPIAPPSPTSRGSPISSSCYQNPSFWEAQVQENRTLLKTFETIINRLQADIDRKDVETVALKQRLKESETVNFKLAMVLHGPLQLRPPQEPCPHPGPRQQEDRRIPSQIHVARRWRHWQGPLCLELPRRPQQGRGLRVCGFVLIKKYLKELEEMENEKKKEKDEKVIDQE